MEQKMSAKEIIARRIALEFKNGDLVNLGVGIPTMIPAFVPQNVDIWLESENGIIGNGPKAAVGEENPFLVDAGKQFCTIRKGGCVFSSATSFGLIRGGHLDYTVLGAFQVDEKGNLANWKVPGGKLAGMGGAMDLVTGAKKVIVATEHCTKDGDPKILQKITYPPTGIAVVDLIVTELAVIAITEKGLVLKETARGVAAEEVIAKTQAKLTVAPDMKEMPV